MRTVEEVLLLAEDLELSEKELANFVSLAPKGMGPERIKFIVAAAEDDMENEDWKQLFQDCQGLSNEAIIKLAYERTSADA